MWCKLKQRLSLSLAVVLLLQGGAFAASDRLIPIGHTVGIEIAADGIMVVQLSEVQSEGGVKSPAAEAGILVGDLICEIDGVPVRQNEALSQAVAAAEGRPLSLTVQREDGRHKVEVRPVRDLAGGWRIGVLARDSLAGIGTITFVDPETGRYGSLGHGVCDSETGVLVPLHEGRLLPSRVRGVQKGLSGEPGALQGEFFPEKTVGTIADNTVCGLYGKITDPAVYRGLDAVPVAEPDEVQAGKAEILSNVEGDSVQRYSAEILQRFPEDDPYGRSMMLRVTDPALLEKTGGIVQGMSGSPVLQNGKLVGAVTHVLVSDPTCGYAISIARMQKQLDMQAENRE